jgi:hypothetical protein
MAATATDNPVTTPGFTWIGAEVSGAGKRRRVG